MAGRCPPVPGADLYSSIWLVGGGWISLGQANRVEHRKEEKEKKETASKRRGGENEA